MTDLHEDVKKMRNTEQDISAKAKTMEYHTGASQVLKHWTRQNKRLNTPSFNFFELSVFIVSWNNLGLENAKQDLEIRYAYRWTKVNNIHKMWI